MKQLGLVVAVVAFCSFGVCAASLSEVAPPCQSMTPKMDGKLDDDCWQTAATLSNFYIVSASDGQTSSDTIVKVFYDDKFLYFGVKCLNPHMRFLVLHGGADDDASIFKDDSVEIFIQREGENRYFHYMLNYAGFKGERRIEKNADGGVLRDIGWNYPWLTARRVGEGEWTAEIAIPLIVLDAAGPGDVRMNIARNKVEVELDQYGAKISERRILHVWSPITKTTHETENFGFIKGLKELYRAQAPFLIAVESLAIKALKTQGENFSFDVECELVGVTPVAGEVNVEVVELAADGVKNVLVSEQQKLPPQCQKKIRVTVPVTDFAPKKLALHVTDQETGLPLVQKSIPFSGSLITAAYPEFSFYSFEKMLRIRVVLDMSPETLQNMSLCLKDVKGKIMLEKKSPLSEEVLETTADVLTLGENRFVVELLSDYGKVFGQKNLIVKRLAGQQNESKADYFRRIAIFKGKPYFPFGMYSGAKFDSRPFVLGVYTQVFKSAKMNTLVTFERAFDVYAAQFSPAEIKKACDALQAINVNVINWGNLQKATFAWETAITNRASVTQEEKFLHAHRFYENELLPNIRNCVEALKHQENFLAWKAVDEPNLEDWQTRHYVQKLFRQTMNDLDPHHAVYELYARTIPDLPELWDNFDFMAYDIYTYPNWNNEHSRPCEPVAVQLTQLDRQASIHRKPIWVVLQPTALDPGRCPLPLNGIELMCQAYAAMICGAKGILYFHYWLANSDETWMTLQQLGEQIETIAPALLNDAMPQQIEDTSGKYDIALWKVPPVLLRVFRFPDGRLIALAVNSKNFPVETAVRVSGLVEVRRLFTNENAYEIVEETFKDKFEPYGVRAYALVINNAPSVINVTITPTLYPAQAIPQPQVEEIKIHRQKCKNLVFNPSFEERRKLKDRPDFYMPYHVLRHHNMNGARDYALDEQNPKFGQVALRLVRPDGYNCAGMFGLAATPVDQSSPYVFSFYARAADDKTRLGLWRACEEDGKIFWKEKKFFMLTKEWARYSIPWEPPIGGQFLMQITSPTSGTIWLDGIQLEKGEQPTEFTEE